MTQRLLAASVLFLTVASIASAQVPSPRATLPQSGAAALASPPSALDAAAEYQIGPEDVLDIAVWKNPELSRTVPVRPDGKVSIPLVNDFQAAGFTPSDLRDQLVSRLSDFVPMPEVSVIVREVHSRKVAVVGAVKTAGRYELKSPMTLRASLTSPRETGLWSCARSAERRRASRSTTARSPTESSRTTSTYTRATSSSFHKEGSDVAGHTLTHDQ
jgi:hypothetical protein